MLKLTISEDNLKLIAQALELQSRILCGQLGEVEHLFRFYTDRKYDIEVVEKKLREIKQEIFKSDYNVGIYSQEAKGIPFDCYELYKQIQHHFHKNDSYWTVHKDGIMVSDKNKIEVEE